MVLPAEAGLSALGLICKQRPGPQNLRTLTFDGECLEGEDRIDFTGEFLASDRGRAPLHAAMPALSLPLMGLWMLQAATDRFASAAALGLSWWSVGVSIFTRTC